MKEIIRKLSDAYGISGREEMALDTVKELVKDMDVKVTCDKTGNIIIHRKGDKPGRIWMSAHMDEIGLMVKKIDGDFIRFLGVGGFDEKVLLAQEVVVLADKHYTGIIGAKPPHLQSAGESDTMLKYKDLYIDLGMKNSELKKHIKIGDRIALRHVFTELKNNQIATKAMDNRSCGAVIISALKLIDNMKNLPDVYAVLNAQEETTFAGATTASYDIFPDVAFVTDVTVAKQPGVDDGYALEEIAIGTGSHINRDLYEFVKKTAAEENIKTATEALPSWSGTDTGAVQLARSGVATVLLSLPVKNMHSPVETGSISAMESMARLIARCIEKIDLKNYEIKQIK